VAEFIGNPPMNVLWGVAESNGISLEGLRLPVASTDGRQPGEAVKVGIRAENIEVLPSETDGSLEARVRVVEPLGSHLLLTLALGEQLLKATTRADFDVAPGATVWLRLEPDYIRLLPADESADRVTNVA
jgi:multiple sugar transport system ATP-binding protein